jgi:hypothetical protein
VDHPTSLLIVALNSIGPAIRAKISIPSFVANEILIRVNEAMPTAVIAHRIPMLMEDVEVAVRMIIPEVASKAIGPKKIMATMPVGTLLSGVVPGRVMDSLEVQPIKLRNWVTRCPAVICPRLILVSVKPRQHLKV